jgi:two-component system OmpR family response regulator
MTDTQTQRILVVDDEEPIRDLIATALGYAGFEVTTAEDGITALSQVSLTGPDLIVLDITMPGFDGWEVCRRLRRDGDTTPVVFLTARDQQDEKLRGFTLGADDYLTKPFSLEELIARIRAVLRRGAPAAALDEDLLSFEELSLDETAHQVLRGSKEIRLSPTEFKLIRYFLLNPGRVLSKSQILDHVWQYDFGGDGNVVDTYVSYLRKKLGEPRLIQTVRGVGYVLRDQA